MESDDEHGKEYTFIYDTGALTVISNDLLKELNLQPQPDDINIEDAYNRHNKQHEYIIDELKLGNIAFNNATCTNANLDQISNITSAPK